MLRHGGGGQGSSGNGIIEKDSTLKISQYMYDRLKALGVPVKMTRDSDVNLQPMIDLAWFLNNL